MHGVNVMLKLLENSHSEPEEPVSHELTGELPRQRPGPRTASMLKFFHSLEPALQAVVGGKVLLFASARPKEGKSTVAGELAVTLSANVGNRVLVVDAGLDQQLTDRYASNGTTPIERLILELRSGVRSGLAGADRRLVFASAGTAATALLDADSWRLLKSSFDFVLVEMPALSESPLALTSARYFDGIILVIEAGRTRWPIVQNAQEQLQRSGATVLGAFLNKRKFYIPKFLYNWL
jgi:Mrp family chromosome partitioning ATPase